jgi:hypothetical protein
MIVSVNGKHVGGMSEAGFEIEVEISGPELVLLVSRYKFASKVKDRIKEAERSYLDAIDNVINDERLLGWTDIGATNTTISSEPEVSVNLETAPASPSVARKPKVSPQTVSARRADDSCFGESVEQVKICRVQDDTNLIRDFVGHTPSHVETKIGKAGELSSLFQETKFNKEAHPQAVRQVPEETTRLTSPSKATPETGDEDSQGSVSYQNLICEVVVEEEDCAHSQGSSQNDLADDEAEECAHSQGSMSSQKTTFETDEQECAHSQGSETIKDAESEWEDDGNAWLGCVCGVIHDEKVAVFWIQCDTCQSWYNVSEECAGLGANDAEKVERWICWGCPVSDGDNCSITNTSVSPQSEAADLPMAKDPSCNADDSSRDDETVQGLAGDGCIRPKSKPREKSRDDLSRDDETVQRLAGDGCIRPKSKPREKSRDDMSRDDETVQRLAGDGCMRPKSRPREKEDGTYARPRGPGPVGFYWHKELGLWSPEGPKREQSPRKLQTQQRATSNVGISASKDISNNSGDSQSEEAAEKDTQPQVAFTRGSLVFIEEHGWAGVSNASGVAKVLKSRVDDDDGLLYDVKYIIGRTAKGVLAEYVSRNKF